MQSMESLGINRFDSLGLRACSVILGFVLQILGLGFPLYKMEM